MSGRATKLALWTILPVGGCLAAALFGPPLAARLMGGGYYAVPSGSMLPGLLPGDRVVGWAPDGMPARGSVVAFRRPDGAEQIARVIALPDEQVAVSGGVLAIDGVPATMVQLEDRVVRFERYGTPPRLPRCAPPRPAPGGPCVQQRWRETLPGGATHTVLNVDGVLGETGGGAAADDLAPVVVPPAHLFVMGDHRDNAVDSRFAALGPVPLASLSAELAFVHFALGDGGLRFLEAVE